MHRLMCLMTCMARCLVHVYRPIKFRALEPGLTTALAARCHLAAADRGGAAAAEP